MAKMTVREFAKSVGLTTSGSDYIACTVMLKMLCGKGVAKEVDRINTSARGRKSVVYEIPEEVRFTLDTVAAVAPDPVVETPVEAPVAVEAAVAVVDEAPVAVEAAVAVVEDEAPVAVENEAEQTFYYDDDEDEAA
jgi:hypothetical protein